MPPNVFVSHATEDKERFVVNLAERLRQNGIAAWLDKWEMLPGDSLVDKVFEGGLKPSDAVIVVLSKFSVVKPWVREELNAAVVKRINDGTKLIPIVIDDCEVPMALISTVHERIKDTSSYDDHFTRIVNAIHGLSDKPAIGAAPRYVSSPIASVAHKGPLDSLLISLACRAALDGNNLRVQTLPIFEEAKKIGASTQEIEDALEILGDEGWFTIHKHVGGSILSDILVTESCLEMFAREHIANYGDKTFKVAGALVNDGLTNARAIADLIAENQLLVSHILTLFEHKGWLTRSRAISDNPSLVIKSMPALRRFLSER